MNLFEGEAKIVLAYIFLVMPSKAKYDNFCFLYAFLDFRNIIPLSSFQNLPYANHRTLSRARVRVERLTTSNDNFSVIYKTVSPISAQADRVGKKHFGLRDLQGYESVLAVPCS
jgi:hypothetical protein